MVSSSDEQEVAADSDDDDDERASSRLLNNCESPRRQPDEVEIAEEMRKRRAQSRVWGGWHVYKLYPKRWH